MFAFYNCSFLSVEITGGEEWIQTPFVNKARELGIPIAKILWIKASVKKEIRVRGLANFYRDGQVWHHPTGCRKLEMQLLTFPLSADWDVMDAFAQMPKIMDEHYMYFESYDVSKMDDPESDYKDLEYQDEFFDDELTDDWAVYKGEKEPEKDRYGIIRTEKRDGRWMPVINT